MRRSLRWLSLTDLLADGVPVWPSLSGLASWRIPACTCTDSPRAASGPRRAQSQGWRAIHQETHIGTQCIDEPTSGEQVGHCSRAGGRRCVMGHPWPPCRSVAAEVDMGAVLRPLTTTTTITCRLPRLHHHHRQLHHLQNASLSLRC
jgi:hypothetical protein